ncbi:hypothetical protein [Actinacidiphila acidipaludis]|uniref:Uncharacterized protein n=1 Tax=Actinacidiphila acidipaludis TaxID=2873382 RepID=A0ABS7QGP8_9ACTN|nr:hypothetical protein [Streptomyces acidipaludis]MBY8880949.1 hypothetical protein [Streptomyces acidipaludis]
MNEIAPEAVPRFPAEPDAEPQLSAGPGPEAAPQLSAEPGPQAAPLFPAAPEAAPEAAPRAPRRRLRAAIRWTAAVLVFAAFGSATAYAVTQPERTRIPGLRTPDDGRWTYPPIALPKLPAGRARPFADANQGQHHFTDVRSLLLPAPVGATADRAVPGPSGWVTPDAYLDLYRFDDDYLRKAQAAELRQQGLRHIAARSWTSPDGTRTDLYLLQFLSSGYADLYEPNIGAERLKGAEEVVKDSGVTSKAVPSDITVDASAESAPYGAAATRYAYLYAGDVIGLVVQTRKGSVAEVPFRQTVRLQAQLLG